MNLSDARLQERLERLETGESLADCQAGLAPDQAELLAVAWALRQVSLPEQATDVAADQRQKLVELAQERIGMNNQTESSSNNNTERSWPRWLLPVGLGATALGAIVLVGVAIIVAAGLFFFSPQRAQRDATGNGQITEGQEPDRTVFGETDAGQIEAASIEVPGPDMLVLTGSHGLVEVQNEDDQWVTAQDGQVLTAGQRIRTGTLSQVMLVFYDGSTAALGAQSEVSIDALDARTDGPRMVVLTQVTGRTRHDVAHSEVEGSQYVVNTPHGTGEAKGTSFTVYVTALFVRFNTNEGTVAVTNLDVTVLVIAGQSSTVFEGEAPRDPVFQITGEGEVNQIGFPDNPNIWEISGQTFLTSTLTEIIGNPQVGDWVSVEARVLSDGTRFADRIELLRRAPENRFELTGEVGPPGGSIWTVDGQEVTVDEDTDIQPGIEEGDTVVASGVVLEGDILLAETIRLFGDEAMYPFEFLGVVESQPEEPEDDNWIISDQEILTDDQTEVTGEIEDGNVVRVEGWIQDDGTWLAESISLVEIDLTFEFTGEVDSPAPSWEIAGIPIETDDETEIIGEIEQDDRVMVQGFILQNGTWLASEIKLIPEEELDEEASFQFELTGEVDLLDPWTVAGVEFTVDDNTDIDEGIEEGSRVHVSGVILTDDEEETLLAETITLLDEEDFIGCLAYVAVVRSVEEDSLTLASGQLIPLTEGIEIEGDLSEGAVILLATCTTEDNTVMITVIVVIGQLDELPENDDNGDTGDSGTPGTVICHIPPGNPEAKHTIMVGESAISSHLAHGDTLGSCP